MVEMYPYTQEEDWQDIDNLDDLKTWIDLHVIAYVDEDMIEFEAINQDVYIKNDDVPTLVRKIKNRYLKNRYQPNFADDIEVIEAVVREYAEKKRKGE